MQISLQTFWGYGTFPVSDVLSGAAAVPAAVSGILPLTVILLFCPLTKTGEVRIIVTEHMFERNGVPKFMAPQCAPGEAVNECRQHESGRKEEGAGRSRPAD